MVQDISTCHARTISFVDNLLPFDDDDTSLRIFLPSQPSSVPLQEERNERDNMSGGVQPYDWISLTLAPGGGGTEQSEPQLQIPVKERRMEPLSDAPGGGGTEQPEQSEPQAQIPVEERRMEPLSDAPAGGGTEQPEQSEPQPQIPVKERRIEPNDAGSSLSYEFCTSVVFLKL
jgi:hypothetical protein